MTFQRRSNGVATRAELDELGVSPGTIARRVKDEQWQRPARSVYFLFPGKPTWEQGLLCVEKWTGGRAVFSHETAGYLHGILRERPPVIDAIVPREMGFTSLDRFRIHRTTNPISVVGAPRRTTLEQTAVDLINSAKTERAALDVLMRAIQRRMDLDAFVDILNGYRRVRHRGFVLRLVTIAAEGVESYLELVYRKRVERAHGLPRAILQKRERIAGRWMRSDCWYKDLGTRVELDGELAHPGRATDEDVMRDNDIRIALNEITLRFRFPHVWSDPCAVAGRVAAALWRNGWDGWPTRCSPTCRAESVCADLLAQARKPDSTG